MTYEGVPADCPLCGAEYVAWVDFDGGERLVIYDLAHRAQALKQMPAHGLLDPTDLPKWFDVESQVKFDGTIVYSIVGMGTFFDEIFDGTQDVPRRPRRLRLNERDKRRLRKLACAARQKKRG